MKRLAIVNVNLEFEIPENVKTDREIQKFVENVELPDEYVTGSIEFVKVFDEE